MAKLTVGEVKNLVTVFNGNSQFNPVVIKEVLKDGWVIVDSVDKEPETLKCHVSSLNYAEIAFANECLAYMEKYGNL